MVHVHAKTLENTDSGKKKPTFPLSRGHHSDTQSYGMWYVFEFCQWPSGQ